MKGKQRLPQCLIVVVAFSLLWLGSRVGYSQDEQKGCSIVIEALDATSHLHVGDTRAVLEKTFTQDGGMAMNNQAVYVYRKCMYLKIDVKFRLADEREMSPRDTIISVSRLYVEAPVEN